MPAPIRRFVKRLSQLTFTIAADGTTASNTISANGFISTMHLTLPNWTNNVTGVLTIVDADSNTIYTSDAKNRNASYTLAPTVDQLPVDGELTITLTLGGVPGGTGGSSTLSIYLS